MLFLQFIQPIMPNVDIRFVWTAFTLGVISHLVMDSLTKEGVPWLLPFPLKLGFPPMRRLRITTGSKTELFVILPALVCFTAWLCARNYTALADLIQDDLIR
ncbi:hypothetical protein CSA80_04995 [Candidatus Saccharibacteria bacterium]|nr:MAG: hypothetical protein CSA80_04995 [Candidatus Saccharibacteria bacterium]